MSSICPVCNGLQELQTNCPVCSIRMSDLGKLSDLLGPYSPYGLEDEATIAMSGEPDNHPVRQCLHVVDCPECHTSYTLVIPAE
ncbi:hypothetical protein [Paenibacillus roseipurpureus]|uniref:Uncharacterized protein n=1 Tax=Paenibacillus roseopurpureus TaxID=2918901 RepID=A0AA96LTD8_9BACL|nr:hypothetical protein [Paenibacillus sp. MBLB1832]WNR45643.1 hypothetical protein MJB10_05955 [Paenibacillus sp. MBLB1832]